VSAWRRLERAWRKASELDRIVPPARQTGGLTLFAAVAMAFLAIFAAALFLTAHELAQRWESALTGSATLRLIGPETERDAVLALLEATPGIQDHTVMAAEEQRALLAPWFGQPGSETALEELPLPQIITLDIARDAFDPEALQDALQRAAPGAMLDDHSRWKSSAAKTARQFRLLTLLALGLIAATLGAVIMLAAKAALAANAQVIGVLRSVGALDGLIAGAFTRRFTLRGLLGGALGSLAGFLLLLGWVLSAPSSPPPDALGLSGLGLHGALWIFLLVIPGITALLAYGATYLAARRALKEHR
jgi:cell division transport system permease protein